MHEVLGRKLTESRPKNLIGKLQQVRQHVVNRRKGCMRREGRSPGSTAGQGCSRRSTSTGHRGGHDHAQNGEGEGKLKAKKKSSRSRLQT